MEKVVLVGAGSAGSKVAEELKNKKNVEVIGFLDKDKSKFGKKINDVMVLGNYDNIKEFVINSEINKIIITTTQMSPDEINHLKEKLKGCNVKLVQLTDIEVLNYKKDFLEQLVERNVPLSVPCLDVEPIVANLRECIESGWVSTGGRFITEFENKIKKYVGVPDAVGIQSGTAGLHTALRVLGVDSNHEVLAPTLTFIAAVNPITYLGAEPVFIGCDHTLCMDPNSIEKFCAENCEMKDGDLYNKKTGKKIKVIVVVHVFGNIADMEKIMGIAIKYNLKVLEDATEALGSYYTEGKYKGKYAGTIGDAGVYSFNANKIITTGGGGMVISNNQEFLDKVRFLSVQAKTDPLYFIHDEIGYNYRMLNLQAALGTEQIDKLESFIATKTKNYKMYETAINEIDGLSLVKFNTNNRSNYWFYSVVVDEKVYGMNKDELLQKLVGANIQTRPIWGLIHEQKPYIKHEAVGVEVAQWYYNRVLNIPCSSNLTDEDARYVIEKLKEFKK